MGVITWGTTRNARGGADSTTAEGKYELSYGQFRANTRGMEAGGQGERGWKMRSVGTAAGGAKPGISGGRRDDQNNIRSEMVAMMTALEQREKQRIPEGAPWYYNHVTGPIAAARRAMGGRDCPPPDHSPSC